jgi:hypothetical protein
MRPRGDFDAVSVRSWAKKTKDGSQTRRLLALPAIDEGASRTESARTFALWRAAMAFHP